MQQLGAEAGAPKPLKSQNIKKYQFAVFQQDIKSLLKQNIIRPLSICRKLGVNLGVDLISV